MVQGESLFEELKRYVGFGPADEQALLRLGPLLAPEFPRVADVFYERLQEHERAREALRSGESTLGRLKGTMAEWMARLFQAPWDESYFELRARIGRVHVRIGLDQHYMFSAMNVLRLELGRRVEALDAQDPALREAGMRALHRILDLELAIMLHTYRDDLLAQAARAERLSTYGQLVGSIGHELRNPLGVIETSLYLLGQRAPQDPAAQKHLARIGAQVKLANGIITHLLDLISDRPLVRAPVELGPLVREAAEAVARPPGVAFELPPTDGPPAKVSGDAVQLRQVLVNLVQNAVEASGAEGVVRVALLREGDGWAVEVRDAGPGVPAEVRSRLFEPLTSGRAKGVGLGLALAKRVVERHGGSVDYAHGEPRGAVFTVHLPGGA